MKKKPQQTKTDPGTFHSSISLADKIVCEDEACIGKAVSAPDAPPAGIESPEAHGCEPGRTSISVGGRQACADEACIGKT